MRWVSAALFFVTLAVAVLREVRDDFGLGSDWGWMGLLGSKNRVIDPCVSLQGASFVVVRRGIGVPVRKFKRRTLQQAMSYIGRLMVQTRNHVSAQRSNTKRSRLELQQLGYLIF